MLCFGISKTNTLIHEIKVYRIKAPKVQASRLCEQSPVFSVCPLKKF